MDQKSLFVTKAKMTYWVLQRLSKKYAKVGYRLGLSASGMQTLATRNVGPVRTLIPTIMMLTIVGKSGLTTDTFKIFQIPRFKLVYSCTFTEKCQELTLFLQKTAFSADDQQPRRQLFVGQHQDFKVGDIVEGRYFNNEWYPAKIAACTADGTYVLLWEDGDLNDRIKGTEQLRKPKDTNAGTSRTGSETTIKGVTWERQKQVTAQSRLRNHLVPT